MTAAASSSRRKALAEAQKDYQELIAFVEDVMVGRFWDDCNGLWEILPRAERLIATLQALNVAMPHELDHFRDYCCERPLTQLGIPTGEDEDGRPFFDVNSGRSWLSHLRDLEQALREEKPSRQGVSGKSRGGRKKDPEVAKLENRVAELYATEIQALVKENVTQPDALKRVRAWSTRDTLKRINDKYDRGYPLRGKEAENLKKQVTRSPAYRQLHDSDLEQRSDDESESPRAMDAACAYENGLRPMRARQN